MMADRDGRRQSDLPTVTIGDEKRVTERVRQKLDATVTVGDQCWMRP
jgi:hypothetical protein